jgi:ferredoxin--NADP+ reductase
MPVFSESELADLRQRTYNATVQFLRVVHEELAILRVRPDFPIPPYEAGQYTTLGLGFWEPRVEGCQPEDIEAGHETKLAKRAYSISHPIWGDDGELLPRGREGFLELYVALVRTAERRAPALTPRLFQLTAGDRLYVGEKIAGHYTLQAVQPNQNVVWMATGTGEAPHNTMLAELLQRGHAGHMASVVCVRYAHDLAYRDTHLRVAARYPNYRYITLTTREERNRGRKQYIQDLIQSGQLEAELGYALEPASAHVFLCGNPKMIGVPQKDKTGQFSYPTPLGVVEILERRGFKVDRPRAPGNIHFEEYW